MSRRPKDICPKETYRWPTVHEKMFNVDNNKRNVS